MELKFRAWVDEINEMRYSEKGDLASFFNYFGHFSVMQFTGRKDKTGEEIYDDDIMRKPTGQTYKVGKQRYSCGGLGILGYKDMSKDETIGNIHENPYLV